MKLDPDAYGPIFAAYVTELRHARSQAQDWWRALLEREILLCGDRALAQRRVHGRWPLGPVCFPRVIAVYRKHYLAVDAMNAALLEEEESQDMEADPLDPLAWKEESELPTLQHPRTVLYEQLDAVDPELARFMDGMVFVPIGADEQGRLA